MRQATRSNAVIGPPDPLLRLFSDGQPRTRGDVTVATGLARSTVRPRLYDLVELGFLRALDIAPSTGGRRAETFAMAPRARSLVAVEVDPSRVRVASFDLGLSMVAEEAAEFDTTRDPQSVLDYIVQAAERVSEINPSPVAGMGVSLPMPLSPITNIPVRPPLMPAWDGLDVVGQLTARTGVEIAVDRENYVAPLAERRRCPEASEDFLMVNVSTWVGAGAVIGGQIVRGSGNAAGHLGHVVGPWPERDLCTCGNRGCLESVASGSALLAELGGKTGVTTTRGLVDAANKGNAEVNHAIREAGRKLGLTLAGYVSVLNPARIVLHGLLAEAGFELLNGVRETIYASSFAASSEDLSVSIAAAGLDSVIVGAGALALEHYLEWGERTDPRDSDANQQRG